jgi:cytochrome c nitrite reductase small subunit
VRPSIQLRVGRIGLGVATLLGVVVGLGSFTFVYGEGGSYFSTDPRACVNCHIMQPQFDSWQKASHHTAAVCVDCHLPHDFAAKYVAKADNGYRHSWAFTFQDFHEPIRMTARNARILQNNCLRCHGEWVHALVDGSTTAPDAVRCTHCHADAGHGPRAGLAR